MKILFHLGHPAHYHLFKNVIKQLKKENEVLILIKKKDVLEHLLHEDKLEFTNLLPSGRKDSKLGIALGQVVQDIRMYWFCVRHKPNILVGTSVAISHVGKLLNIPSINVNEDDADVVPLYAKLAYPWASCILAPSVCSTGKWEKKTIIYKGYHELAYLHPNNFKADKNIVEKYFSNEKPYFIIRFTKLSAYHDEGKKGINRELAVRLINLLKPHGNVFITSERILEKELEPYRIAINPIDIHHILHFASICIGDSQTMAAEAGVLGTPFIRFNDFIGRIGYLDELENKYQLGFGIKSDNPDGLIKKTEELLQTDGLQEIFFERRKKMLEDKIDVAEFFTWFIENYPKSVDEVQLCRR